MARLTRPSRGEDSARRARFPSTLACQLSRAVCRLVDRLRASQGFWLGPLAVFEEFFLVGWKTGIRRLWWVLTGSTDTPCMCRGQKENGAAGQE